VQPFDRAASAWEASARFHAANQPGFANPQSLTWHAGVIRYTVPNWCFLPVCFSDAD
jgi:hypothetical protein